MRMPSLRSFPSRVDIYRIAETWDADVSLTGAYASTPDVTVRECSMQPYVAQLGDATGQVTTVFECLAFFRVNDHLKKLDKIVWVDGTKTHVLFVNGEVNVVGRGTIWKVPLQERSIEA
jgi:hypothetical protein